MAKRDPRMIPLGYGKFVRADRVYALVPIEGAERRDGRRTYVHVDGLVEPIVASRSERAILSDVEAALAEAAGLPRRRRVAVTGQESPARRAPLQRLEAPLPSGRGHGCPRSYNSSTSFRTFCTDSLASPNRSDVFSL